MTLFLTRQTDGSIKEIIGLSNSDTLGRQRVSSPQTVFQLSHQYDKQPLYIEEKLISSGSTTHLPNESAVRLNVTTTVGSRVVRQTKRYFQHQIGKSQQIILAGMLITATNAGVISRIGYFDDTVDKTVDTGGDGVFFEYSAGQLHIVLRSFSTGTQVDTKITKGSWNQGDQLDGLGSSGITLDPTKPIVMWIDTYWLGIRVGIIYNGKFIHLHSFYQVTLRKLSLPVRYELIQVTGSAAASSVQYNMSVITEGEANDTGRVFSTVLESTQTVGTTIAPIVNLRLRNSHCRGNIIPLAIDVMLTSNQYVHYHLIYGANITGGTWSNHDTANSSVETNLSSSGITGGRRIYSGFVPGNTRQARIDINTLEIPAVSIAGVVENVTLAVKATGVTSIYGSISWREEF